MSKILKIDQFDLVLTYSWSNNNHGICGHTFEVIDYYLHLKDKMNTGILLCEDIDADIFRDAIEDKYDLVEEEIHDILHNTIFFNRPRLVRGKNILFTDGGTNSLRNVTLLFDNIFHFACGDASLQLNNNPKVHVLQDYRVYGACFNSVDYKKKINFKKYKQTCGTSDKVLLYGSKNCRLIPDEKLDELIDQHDNDFLCLVSEIPSEPKERVEYSLMPYKNLFDNFGLYVYTPVPRKFDCSPRLIAECKFYGKHVLYAIDYGDEDLGLKYRKHDVQYDFESLFLDDDDEIFGILNDIITNK